MSESEAFIRLDSVIAKPFTFSPFLGFSRLRITLTVRIFLVILKSSP